MKSVKKFTTIVLLLLITMIRAQYGDHIQLNTGPYLFIDDYLIAHQEFISRTINQPVKYPIPVITAGEKGDQNFQPWMTVLKDEDTGLFRMWYNTPEHRLQSHIGYIESKDGINWIRPHRMLKDPHEIKFNVSVIDGNMK